MPIRSRIGPRLGPGGLRIGSDFGGVTRDATSLKYTPAAGSEWTTLLAGTGLVKPDNLWLLQEASGNFADSVGAQALTAVLITAYQASVAGWSRKFVTTTPQGGGRGGSVSSGTMPNLSTTAQMSLLYVCRTAVITADRDVCKLGAATTSQLLCQMSSAHRLEITPSPGVGTPVLGTTVYAQDTVFPLILQHDPVNSVQRVATPSERFTATFTALGANRGIAFGTAGVGLCLAGAYGYYANWQGAPAQMTEANIRTLLQKLGWTVAW